MMMMKCCHFLLFFQEQTDVNIRGVVWVGVSSLDIQFPLNNIYVIVCALQCLEDLGLGHLKPEMLTQNIDR
jgi:hypothetical protein